MEETISSQLDFEIVGIIKEVPAQLDEELAKFYVWGNAAYEKGDFSSLNNAIKFYSEIFEKNKEIPEVCFNFGCALCKRGMYDLAIAYFDVAIKLKDDFAEAWNNKGVCHAILGKFEEAFECYDKALKINPKLEVARKNIVRTTKSKEVVKRLTEGIERQLRGR